VQYSFVSSSRNCDLRVEQSRIDPNHQQHDVGKEREQQQNMDRVSSSPWPRWSSSLPRSNPAQPVAPALQRRRRASQSPRHVALSLPFGCPGLATGAARLVDERYGDSGDATRRSNNIRVEFARHWSTTSQSAEKTTTTTTTTTPMPDMWSVSLPAWFVAAGVID
jgi:hypothetical protein